MKNHQASVQSNSVSSGSSDQNQGFFSCLRWFFCGSVDIGEIDDELSYTHTHNLVHQDPVLPYDNANNSHLSEISQQEQPSLSNLHYDPSLILPYPRTLAIHPLTEDPNIVPNLVDGGSIAEQEVSGDRIATPRFAAQDDIEDSVILPSLTLSPAVNTLPVLPLLGATLMLVVGISEHGSGIHTI